MGGRAFRGLLGKAGLGLVFLIELLSEGGHLSALEIGELDGSPTLGGADHGAEHELEDGLFAEGIGDDLQAPAFLDEEALQQVRRAGRPAVRDRQPQVGDAGLEVVHEAGDRAG